MYYKIQSNIMQTTILFFHGYRQDVNKKETSKAYNLLETFIKENTNDEVCMSFVNWNTENVKATITYNLHIATSAIKNKENFILIGHSAGGNIATTIYNELQKKNLYSKLVLINPLVDKSKSTLPEELLMHLNADYSKVKDSEIILSIFDDVTTWQTANSILQDNNGILFEAQAHQVTSFTKCTYKNLLAYIHKQI